MITQKIIRHILSNKIETKQTLATKLGITPVSIHNYNHGCYEMNPTKLMALCKMYNLNINDFYEETNQTPQQ